MTVIHQAAPAATAIPGIAHATWAGADHGLSQLSVWRQTLAPGAGTPMHGHGCDEVVLCESGHGEVEVDGRVQAFGPRTTLTLPRGTTHRIVNTGAEPLEIVGLFGASPVPTWLPGGVEMALPWRT